MAYIIAEAGSNYNGSVERALELNSLAKESGADCIKYQIIYADGLYLPGSYPYGDYQSEAVLKVRRSNELSDSEWWTIRDHAESIGLDFSASVFDERGLELLQTMNPPFVKVASSDLNNHLFLRKVGAAELKVVLSTGMASLEEIETSIQVLFQSGLQNDGLVVMHCVSSYPTERQNTRVGFLTKLKKLTSEVGFSDHSTGTESAIAALALGAKWFEKHFTSDRSLPGLDHAHSLELSDLTEYVRTIRDMEASLSTDVPKISEAEAYTAKRARRGIYARIHIAAGTLITESEISIVRPPSELSADEVDLVLGKRALQDINAGEPIQKLLIGP